MADLIPGSAKSEGQALLERLRDVHRDLTAIALDLAALKHVIGLAPSLPKVVRAARSPQDGSIGSSRPITQFFPALRMLADELEGATQDLATDVKDLAGGF